MKRKLFGKGFLEFLICCAVSGAIIWMLLWVFVEDTLPKMGY